MRIVLFFCILIGIYGTIVNAVENHYSLMTNGQCEDVICYNKYSYRLMTNGQCEDVFCYNKYSYRLLTNGQCEDAACYNKKFNNNLGSNGSFSPSIGGGIYRSSKNYIYDISGYGGQGYAYGNIDTDGNGDVDGYIYLEDGREVYFEGEFVGKGEIEGYDEDGNWYEFEVD